MLTKALVRASEGLGMTRDELAHVLGRNRTGLIRDGIDPKGKTGELALLLIRIYQALFVLVGGDSKAMKHWVKTENRAFGNVRPLDRLQKVEGLVQVAQYLDAMRGKI
ncbi:MbcA/ParS/Xre antitoxin family protein [Allohahella marinimesophila]|uniref:MbcA/ParS/Xre antitoxin family protein n=1 Tax=Allohahella marinimesophila TaxID=1054972 RepID=A0ABP7PS53_9GAMM